MALALITSVRKLRPYFQLHTIVILTDQPLGKVLKSPVASGRLVNWSVELREFDIRYKPHVTIKAQALSNFIVEYTLPKDLPQLILSKASKLWRLYVDGSSKIGDSGAGICGQHLGGRNLTHKILRQGYYWPGMQKDAVSFTRRCDQCQKFAPLSHMPAIPLNILTSPILFTMWGMEILGPFSMAMGQRHFVITAIDYFTKWTEAEPLATITEAKCEELFWKNVVFRFGIPKVRITDNGKQFDNSKF
ncbi:hypothetical protein RJ639_001736 [Escallonia herrerae]|uniref:Integrase catalytic domain-containing protein n=1 Tax=Escallonia herrerae TaxID=1293975 RepID=A0AA88XCK1_9ASTE|nr:hypothetical protein RJ639_001736 [Escallonia herrerae]